MYLNLILEKFHSWRQHWKIQKRIVLMGGKEILLRFSYYSFFITRLRILFKIPNGSGLIRMLRNNRKKTGTLKPSIFLVCFYFLLQTCSANF